MDSTSIIPRGQQARGYSGHLGACESVADRARRHFPVLSGALQHPDEIQIYADNSSSTQVCQEAADEVTNQTVLWSAHKGADPALDFSRPRRNSAYLQAAREGAARLCGGEPAGIGFTVNASTVLMLLAGLLGRRWLRPNDIVAITRADHDSNRDAWLSLEGQGIRIVDISGDAEGAIDHAAFRKALQQRPRLVALNAISNTTGVIQDCQALAYEAHAVGAVVVLDAVQAPPHGIGDALAPDVDIAVFSNCKMFAPHLGWWAVRQPALDAAGLPPHLGRHPELEHGTPPLAAIAGMHGVCRYFEELGGARGTVGAFDAIVTHERDLSRVALDRIRQNRALRLFGPSQVERRVPIFCLDIDGRPWRALYARFKEAKIEARFGSFRCKTLVEDLAGSPDQSLLRLSFAHYNTIDEVEAVFDVLDAALRC